MDTGQVQDLVRQVIKRLAPLMGADGEKGKVICVFTGATVGLPQAMVQLTRMVMNGYSLRLFCSDSAGELYGELLLKELGYLPFVSKLEPASWLDELRSCNALAVPLLSVNSLSMLAGLLASGPAANLMLHALFMGKPMLAAVDGACPDSQGRSLLGFDQGKPALAEAVNERLATIASYGCRLCQVDELAATLDRLVSPKQAAPATGISRAAAKNFKTSGKILTAADVRKALGQGSASISGPAGMVVTALAQDEAQRHGLSIIR